MTPRLKQLYHDEIQSQLKDELGLENIMQVPRMVKINVNMGLGDAAQDSKLVDSAVDEMRTNSPGVATVADNVTGSAVRCPLSLERVPPRCQSRNASRSRFIQSLSVSAASAPNVQSSTTGSSTPKDRQCAVPRFITPLHTKPSAR